MKRLYADVNHVSEAVEKALEMTESFMAEDVHIGVFESEAVMRGIDRETLKERNITRGKSVCEFRYDGTRLTLHFHENVTKGTFKLRPAGHNAIAADQASKPEQLAPALAPVIKAMEADFDIISWDFTEVSAASIAHGGHFTDFEFEYVVTL